MQSRRLSLLVAAIALVPAAALAHAGHAGHEALGFLAGFAHPFTGADHMLAMTAVGLWAALRGGRAIWAWPAAFVAAMLGGFLMGQGGTAPFVEPAILASVIVLGALVAAQAIVPLAPGALLIAAFGLAHGWAHGAETPLATGGFPLGFVVATVALHLIGLAAGSGLQRLRRPGLLRLLGAGAAAGGVLLAVA